jgi:hypothetical protein
MVIAQEGLVEVSSDAKRTKLQEKKNAEKVAKPDLNADIPMMEKEFEKIQTTSVLSQELEEIIQQNSIKTIEHPKNEQ